MFYKPKFCCNCGEKIERPEWHLLSSRRFCEVCEVENKGHEWLPRVIVGLGVAVGLFGLGSMMGGRSADVQPMPVRVAQPGIYSSGPNAPIAEQRVSAPSSQMPQQLAQGQPTSQIPAPQVSGEQPRPRAETSEQPVYFCGAMTKKGKPCSRRVKVKGRCWQHAGLPSAVEPPKAADVY